jgi:hypothetical protein
MGQDVAETVTADTVSTSFLDEGDAAISIIGNPGTVQILTTNTIMTADPDRNRSFP